MLSNQKSKFYLLIARLDFQCLLPVNRSTLIDVQYNTWLFLINPVNGLVFVCLSFHFMMLG